MYSGSLPSDRRRQCGAQRIIPSSRGYRRPPGFFALPHSHGAPQAGTQVRGRPAGAPIWSFVDFLSESPASACADINRAEAVCLSLKPIGGSSTSSSVSSHPSPSSTNSQLTSIDRGSAVTQHTPAFPNPASAQHDRLPKFPPNALLLLSDVAFVPHITSVPHSMFDPRLCSPDSPVDSAMFPPVYNRSTSSSSTASMSSCPGDVAPLPSIRNNNELVKPLIAPTFKQELLEPFEFRPNTGANPTPRAPNGTSLSSVFGDQDLIDAIMFSLNTEQQNNNPNVNVANIAIPAFSPSFAMPRRVIQQVQVPQPTSFTALMQQRPIGVPMPDGRIKPTMAGPCLRKPGTFLNKDGRWIKGKPCRMEGCDKRAQSNGLCKGHGGGARCSFAGCSKSSQGGGFCRAHGGGKRCMHEGCEKGTQRNGFCYLHGGVRSCTVEGCDKKDRGNGKCFSHGGGRKCQAHMCFNTIRRGAFCDLHNSKFAK